MKPLRRLFAFSLLALLLGLAILPGRARAQDTICYVLMKVPKLEVPVVRYEMAAARANHFADGQDFFTSTRGARRVVFLGKVGMAGGQRADLKRYLPPSWAYNGPWEQYDTRISIAAVKSGEGREALMTVDTGVVFRGAKSDTDASAGTTPSSFARFAATSQMPLRPNAWQEVAYWSVDHYCVMLWQYPLVKNPPESGSEPEPPPLYRLEMTVGILPEESLARLASYDAERKRLIAESYSVLSQQWTSFSLHCLPDQPFSASTARGLSRKVKDEAYLASSTCSFTGTLGIQLGTIALKSEFRTPAPQEKDRLVIPFAADLVPGEWHIQRIAEEPVIYGVGHNPRNPREPARANAAFYRLVEVKR